MAANLLSLRLLSALLLAVSANPAPGRSPKVYNALITSNQNLEPSKSYPVYQPVLHDSFGFSLHPSVIYGEIPFSNGILPAGGEAHQPEPPKGAEEPIQPSLAPPAPEGPVEPAASEPTSADTPTPAPNADSTTLPQAPNTESPIPLNEFGLPSQVVPLGRVNPAYNGFTQLGPFTYPYPGVRLYDPYEPFNLGPYGFPFYRPLTNVLGPSLAGPSYGGPNYGGIGVPLVPAHQAPVPAPADSSAQTPPPEPSDLSVLNYSSKDPAIPNVPPPPLPQGGLKSDKSE